MKIFLVVYLLGGVIAHVGEFDSMEHCHLLEASIKADMIDNAERGVSPKVCGVERPYDEWAVQCEERSAAPAIDPRYGKPVILKPGVET